MNAPKDKAPVDAPRAEAAEWFINLQATDVSRTDQEAFADWLRRSPVHIEEFLQLTALHEDLSRLPEFKNLDVDKLLENLDLPNANIIDVDFQSNSLSALEGRKGPAQQEGEVLSTSVRERVRSTEQSGPQAVTLLRRPQMWATAAGAALIAIGLFAISPIRNFLTAEHYNTDVGEQRSLTLADGSHVQLNVQSRLMAKIDDTIRDVRLSDGEALFQVAKDPSRPFRVHTPQATIEAKGTEFNVNVLHGQTTVALLEGHVLITPSGSPPVTLEPGQQLTIATRAADPPAPRKADPKTVTAWTERRLVFEDTPLAEVIEEFNRYSRQPLVIQDPTLRDQRITASFESGSAAAFGASLAASGGLRVIQQRDGTWLIER